MASTTTTWDPEASIGWGSIRIDDLEITFVRTLRVPDNNKDVNHLPPGLGRFELQRVDQYSVKLPADMAAKGGIFFPMYQREALWMNFRSSKPYAMKIYVGGVNAVSGEVAGDKDGAEKKLALWKEGKNVQDYIVVPNQLWLDGIAVEPGKVRQFVAMPTGSGYSVEKQITGKEQVAGIQFEITPRLPWDVDLTISDPDGEGSFQVRASCDSTLGDLAEKLRLYPGDGVLNSVDGRVNRVSMNSKYATLEELGFTRKQATLQVTRAPRRSDDFYSRDRNTEIQLIVARDKPIAIKVGKKDTVNDLKFLIEDAIKIAPARLAKLRIEQKKRKRSERISGTPTFLDNGRHLLTQYGVQEVRAKPSTSS
jgi:hypothetical protein